MGLLNVPTALIESADVDELLKLPPAKVEPEVWMDSIALGIKGAANKAAFGLANLLLIAVRDASPLSCINAASAEVA
jgi:hypothetical protein